MQVEHSKTIISTVELKTIKEQICSSLSATRESLRTVEWNSDPHKVRSIYDVYATENRKMFNALVDYIRPLGDIELIKEFLLRLDNYFSDNDIYEDYLHDYLDLKKDFVDLQDKDLFLAQMDYLHRRDRITDFYTSLLIMIESSFVKLIADIDYQNSK